MRSSKSRSRSKANRPRTLGNIINRVFDSSGPEGKVRGTPQQIIEKYQLLARDAQLSNDRVAAENFLQHAEHYTRLLGEAMREMAAEQEERQRNQQSNPQQGGGQGGHQSHQGGGQQNGNRDRDRDNRDQPWRDRQDRGDYRDQRSADDSTHAGAVVIELGDAGDTNLVETPEARPFQPRRDDRGERPNDRPNDRPDRNPRGDFRRDRDRDRDRDARRDTPATAQPATEPRSEPAQADTPAPAQAPASAKAPRQPAAPAPVAEGEAPKKTRAPRKPKEEGDKAAKAEKAGSDPAAAAE